MSHVDSCQFGVNEAGSSSEIDTRLTRGCSPTVRSFTYFIEGENAIKIGHSWYPKGRMKDIQCSTPVRLKLLLSVPTSMLTESAAHAKFQHLRISGEWFRPSPELLDFIEEMREQMFPKPTELIVLAKHLAKCKGVHARSLAQQISVYEKATEYNRAALRPIIKKSMELIASRS